MSGTQRSHRLKAIGVKLFVVELSYGAVEDARHGLRLAGSKASVWRCS